MFCQQVDICTRVGGPSTARCVDCGNGCARVLCAASSCSEAPRAATCCRAISQPKARRVRPDVGCTHISEVWRCGLRHFECMESVFIFRPNPPFLRQVFHTSGSEAAPGDPSDPGGFTHKPVSTRNTRYAHAGALTAGHAAGDKTPDRSFSLTDSAFGIVVSRHP